MDRASITRMFLSERDKFAAKYPHVAGATLHFSVFKREKQRDCCITDVVSNKVHFHSEVAPGLNRHQCLALIRHELAHVCDPDISESDTDRLAEKLSGEPIYYGNDDDIQTVASENSRRPRPSYLPEW